MKNYLSREKLGTDKFQENYWIVLKFSVRGYTNQNQSKEIGIFHQYAVSFKMVKTMDIAATN